MAQIDQLLGSIARFGATGAVLASDEKVMLSFPDGPRYASQTTPHATLVRLVEEILPAGVDMQSLGLGASDLNRSPGTPPRIRVHGAMKLLPGAETSREHVLLEQIFEITPDRNQQEFEARNDTDFGYSIPEVSRFRANLFRDRRGPGAVFRAIPFEIRTPDELGLPPQVLDLCSLTKGLVLVTGPTGSGKS